MAASVPIMVFESPGIAIVRSRIGEAELSRLVRLHFEDMVKCVVDVERAVGAVYGEMQPDAERLLLEEGNRQVADVLRVLYGASVKPDNVKGLMAHPDVDGALVGGASLKGDSFLKLVHYDKQ